MNRQLRIGLLLVTLCTGLGIAFFVMVLMTPDFDNWKGAGIIFVLLLIGLAFGANEIDNVDKWISDQILLKKKNKGV